MRLKQLLFLSICFFVTALNLEAQTDSLAGFDKKGLKATIDAARLSADEGRRYTQKRQRDFIKQKYFPAEELVSVQPDKSMGSSSVNSFTCNSSDFEGIVPGKYTGPNPMPNWTVSSQNYTSCTTSASWTPGSKEFSVMTTPILNYLALGNIPPSPLGGQTIVRMNDDTSNYYRTRIRRKFAVTNTNTAFRFAYCGVYLDGGHSCCEQSHFKIELRDTVNENLFYCFQYSMAATPGSCYTASNAPSGQNSNFETYKFWQTDEIDLGMFLNNSLYIDIISSDCMYGGHYGSTFFDAYCGDLQSPTAGIYSYVAISNCPSGSLTTLHAPMGFATYSWVAPSGEPTLTPAQASSSILVIPTPTNAGPVYTVFIQGGIGYACNYVSTVTVFPWMPSQIGGFTNSRVSCTGGSSGSSTVFVNGSSAGYNYNWYNSTSSVVSTASVANNLAPGVYTVVVTVPGSPGCGTVILTPTIGAAPAMPSYSLASFCTSTAYINAPSGSNYQWYVNGSIVSSSAGGTAPSFSINNPVSGNTAAVTLISSQGCRDSVNYVLAPANAGTLTAFASSVCPGSNNGTSVVLISPYFGGNTWGGSFTVTSISPAPNYSFVSGALTTTLGYANNLSALGKYSIVASDGACLYTDTISVPLLIEPFDFTVTPANATLCANQSMTMGMVFSPTLTGAFNYSWSPATFISSPNFATVMITPSVNPGNSVTIIYTVSLIPSVNCPLDKTVSVTMVNLQTPTISPVPTLCTDATVYTIVASPGGGKFQNPLNSFFPVDPNNGTVNLANTTPGNHSFTYTIKTGTCSANTSSTFFIEATPTLQLSYQDTVCAGETLTISASGAQFYSWSNQQAGSAIVLTPLSTTVYSVNGTNNTCSASTFFTVNVDACVGLARVAANEFFTPYPVPTVRFLYLEKNNQYKIFSADGKEHSLFITDGVADLANFSPGVYTLQLIKKGRSTFTKVIKIE